METQLERPVFTLHEARERLAIDGGTPTITTPMPTRVRWGDAERSQLAVTLDQPSLFYWKGPQTALLIERFQKYYPLEFVMPCSSGTAAIHIALHVAGIGPGDEIITTPATDLGTVIGILYQQGVPVFADIEPHRYTLSVAAVRRALTPRTRAIIAVHLMGNPCDLAGLKQLADEHNLILIEDCAQAWGAMYRGKPVGTVGHLGCYSLNDFKHIGCGDGGIVATNDQRFGRLLQKSGDKGYDRISGGSSSDFLAPNYRITELQSAVAAVQMLKMWEITGRRETLGRRLTEKLRGVRGFIPPEVDASDRWTCSYYLFCLDPMRFTCTRDEFAAALNAEGVSCGAGYRGKTLYQLPVFRNHNFFAGRWPIKELGLTNMDYAKTHCPDAERMEQSVLKTSIHEAMNEEWIDAMASAIRKVASWYAKQ